MLQTRILRVEEWPLVEPIMREGFENAMPVTPEQANFLAAFDGEKLVGFIHVEHLFHVNCMYVAPEHRKTRIAWDMMREVYELIPRGFSAVVLTDKAEVGRLVQKLGFTDKGQWQFLRKDF